jgi:hypothetical protein
MQDSNVVCGCRALIGKINKQFMEFLKKSWGPKTVKLLRDALEYANEENDDLGLPAFHVEGSEHAIKAREGAVAESICWLESAGENLVQSCCINVLQRWKKKFFSIVMPKMVKESPVEVVKKLREQREKLEGACNQAICKWEEYWIEAVHGGLRGYSGAEDTYDFNLGRFPAFLSKIKEFVAQMLEPAKQKILSEVQTLISLNYSNASPWVSIRTNLQYPYATVSARCTSTDFVEKIIFCFVQQSIEVLERLPAQIAKVAAVVPDADWLESCAQERRELERRILKLSDAKKDILDMLSVQNEEEFVVQLSEPDSDYSQGSVQLGSTDESIDLSFWDLPMFG